MGRYLRAAVAALMLSAAGVAALSQQAAAASSTRFYVDRNSPACSDSGPGSRAVPYCTIQEAANVATAGDTVVIAGSNDDYFNGGYSPYDENVVITHSGTSSAPITFEPAVQTYTLYGPAAGFTIKGDYVDVVGATIGSQQHTPIVVSGSHDTIAGVEAELNVASVGPTIDVEGTGTTIERSRITGYAANVIVLGPQAENTTVTTDIVHLNFGTPVYSAIEAIGGSGVVATSNTIEADCGNGIVLVGSTQNADVDNNVIVQSCQGSTSTPFDFVVGISTAPTTRASYNILSTANGLAPAYSWAGTTYTTAAALQKGTGQGTADLVESTFDFSTDVISPDNPAIDSANSNAPGELSTDIYGNPRVDNPAVPNTGAGRYSYYDRGAIEYQEFTQFTLASYADSPQRVALIFGIKGVAWGTDAKVQVDWGDGSDHSGYWQLGGYVQFYSGYFELFHPYAQRGTYTVTATLTDSTQTLTRTITVTTTGSTYQPVTPTRVLDTRVGIGAVAAKVGPMSGITVDVAGVPGAPARSTITAVVANVTVTNESAPGYIAAYPYGRNRPNTSNINFNSWTVTPNLVTVKVSNGKFDLFNGSSGGVDLIADVQGYYVNSAAGSGYVALSPTRILDTRKGLGGTVVQPGGTLTLPVEGVSSVPTSGVTAVALNVTAIGSTDHGYLTVYPDGSTPPRASNLNYGGGGIAQNLVLAKVGSDGKIAFRNNSTGTIQLIADLAGYYTAGGDPFVPGYPVRLLDTRNGTGQQSSQGIPVAPMSNARWALAFLYRQSESALVANVTVTRPQTDGYITAYPGGTGLPATSNIDFSPNQTIANLVMSKVGSGTVNLFNHSAARTELIADVFGYFS